MENAEYLVHKDDVSIVRDDPDHTGMAVIFDCEGDIHFQFPMNWSDDAIYVAIKFANQAYEKGHRAGQWAKAREIKKVLECA